MPRISLRNLVGGSIIDIFVPQLDLKIWKEIIK